MSHRPLPKLLRLAFLISLAATGCGRAAPLKMASYSGTRGPWCAPNQRVQIGKRVVGTVGWGENKWKNFLVDDAGKEYDPEVLADRVWSYLERTGDAATIMGAYHNDGRLTGMTVVAVKPVVVIVESRPLPPGASRAIAAPERAYWVSQISAERVHPDYRDGLRWCSPDLKQPPTALAFSAAGAGEIPLPDGRLRLVRGGNECKTTRE